MAMTPFEQQLKTLFPDVYEIHLLGKAVDQGGGGEIYIWDLVQLMLELNQGGATGTIFVNYSNGRISSIDLKRTIKKQPK